MSTSLRIYAGQMLLQMPYLTWQSKLKRGHHKRTDPIWCDPIILYYLYRFMISSLFMAFEYFSLHSVIISWVKFIKWYMWPYHQGVTHRMKMIWNLYESHILKVKSMLRVQPLAHFTSNSTRTLFSIPSCVRCGFKRICPSHTCYSRCNAMQSINSIAFWKS